MHRMLAAYSFMMEVKRRQPALPGIAAAVIVACVSLPTRAVEPSKPGGPQRIITIAPNSAEILCALGVADRIVAVSKFCVFPPKLADKPRVGGLFDPDIEKIIASRPDLIVLRGQSESVERLGVRLGVTVYHDRTETLADVPICVRELGQIVGRSTEAERLVLAFRHRLDSVRRRAVGKKRPRVMVTASRQPARFANLLTAGRGNFLDDAITIAGGVNVFGDLDMAWPQISTESIVTRAPDVIVELMPEQKLTDSLRAKLNEQWQVLGTVPAVKDGKVFFLADENSLIPSLRYVEVVEKLSRLLHPEVADGK